MSTLETGIYYGKNTKTLTTDGILISDTRYPSGVSFPWHTHKNPYFAFVRDGLFTERTKKEESFCEKGMLLFHHSEDKHCNEVIESGGSLHVEIDTEKFDRYHVDLDTLHGVSKIENPHLKYLFGELVKEFDIADESSQLAIEGIVLQVLSQMKRTKMNKFIEKPEWVDHIKHYIIEHLDEKITLADLSQSLNLHPLTVSRTFEKYEHCKLTSYIRKTRINKSKELISEGNLSLTEIALACGFYDQSHFIKTFKRYCGTTPKKIPA